MSVTRVKTPTSKVMFGYARENIDQPIGIFHPMWGAATHHRATGKHRELLLDVVAIGSTCNDPVVRVQLDIVGLTREHEDRFVRAVSKATGVSPDRIVLSSSHTHATAIFMDDRLHQPGGEFIADYVDSLESKLMKASVRAIDQMEEAVITYATGRCAMAVNRDYWDDSYDGFTCGYNPEKRADDTVMVGRVTQPNGNPVVTIVNYACHPTTLAWENTLLSPDYVGAMRDEVTRVTGVPTVFFLGACGDLSPRRGYVKDHQIADANGRQLAFSVLSAIESMGPPAHDYVYDGPVTSGATLGIWSYHPLSEERWDRVTRFGWESRRIALPLKPLQSKDELLQSISEWEAKQREAAQRGDAILSRDCGAHIERAKRWLSRIDELAPVDGNYLIRVTVLRMGDAVWVTTGGEPYSWLQEELRRRFPNVALIVSGVAGDWPAGYLLPADLYGQGLYQEEPSPLAPGCLEMLTDSVSEVISNLI